MSSPEYEQICCAREEEGLHVSEGPGGKRASQRGDVDWPYLLIRFVYTDWPRPTTSSRQVTPNGLSSNRQQGAGLSDPTAAGPEKPKFLQKSRVLTPWGSSA